MEKTIRRTLGFALCAALFVGTHLYAQDEPPAAYNGPKEHLHIYLLIGQSNMAGRAPFSQQEAAVIPRCYLLDGDDQWVPAKNPLNSYSTIRKDLGGQKMNPGYTFSKTMLEKDKRISIGLVVNAKGGTKIEQWKKGTHFYNEAVRRTKKAQETGVLKGILWHQGEGNVSNAEQYLGELSALIANLRTDLGDPNLPFVAGEILYPKSLSRDQNPINNQIAMLPNAVPFTGVASAQGLTLQDYAHFDAKSMKLLGERYAEEMLKIQRATKAEQQDAEVQSEGAPSD